MSSREEQANWDLLHVGTGREHLDDPASVPVGQVPGTATFRFAMRAASDSDGSPRRKSRARRAFRTMVRPYTRTGGRTQSDLALEALVSTSDRGRETQDANSLEYRRICDLCIETRSVAEVSALLGFPLGVGKILVQDLADAGLVLIHDPGLVVEDSPSLDFLERVLHGIRSL